MKRRRFRLRRKRMAAAALLPMALAIGTGGPRGQGAPTAKAEIDASAHSVPIGDRVVLEGSFPGAARAPIAVSLPRQGLRIVAPDRGRPHRRGRSLPAARGARSQRLLARRARRGEHGPGGRRHPGARSTPTPVPSGSRSARGPACASPAVIRLVGDRVEIRGTVSPPGCRAARRHPGGRREARCRRRPRRPLQAQVARPEDGGVRGRGQGALEPDRDRQPRLGRAAGRSIARRLRPGTGRASTATRSPAAARFRRRRWALPTGACHAGPRSACATQVAA